MKTQIYVTQKIYNERVGDSSYYGIFAVRELPNGEFEFYSRNVIGTWKKVESEDVIRYYRRSEPIKIEEAMTDTNAPVKMFKRTASRIVHGQSGYDNSEKRKDASYLNEETPVLAVLPNGTLIADSDFIRKYESKQNCPVGVIDPAYVSDGNYVLEDSGETIDQTKIAEGLKAEFESQLSSESESAK